jgi:hypothetical protein
MYKYIILNFSKNVGHTNTRIPHTATTARGNLVLTVEEDFIDRFNVPVFLDKVPFVQKRSSTTFTNARGTKVFRSAGYHKPKSRKGEKLVEIQKKTANSDFLNPLFLPKKYYLRFPRFFNQWMIDNALFQIIGNAPDIERLRYRINGKKILEIEGEETDYGSVTISRQLIAAKKPHHSMWGEVCYMATLKRHS